MSESMSEMDFEALLHRTEGDKLDFKERMYNISYDPDKARFIKDIICMVNTPREEDAYIVLGVRKNHDGSFEILGLDTHIDPELFTSQFPPDRIHPIPFFSYSNVFYQEKRCGVIKIPWKQSGPCVPLKDFPISRIDKAHNILRELQIYWRRGSRNSVATPEESNHITQWFKGVSAEGISTLPLDNAWERFIEGVDNFELTRRYILLAAPLDNRDAGTKYLSAFGLYPWSMVLDFDPDSEDIGLLSAVKPILEERRNLHYVVTQERPIMNVDKATYWFFARGLQGRSETLCIEAYSIWNKRYGLEISEQLKRMAGATNPLPVTCVVVWYDMSLISHLRAVLSDVSRAFQDRIKFVIVTKHPADLQTICSEVEIASPIDIPFHQLCSGLQSTAKVVKSEENLCKLPSSSGAEILLDQKTRQKLEEELELVSLSEGSFLPVPDYTRKDFLRGTETEISWYGLNNNFDVIRDRAWKTEKDLKESLDKNRIAKIDLYHDAGAGGTTIARRILWNLHREYPCAILRRCSIDTVDRLYSLTHLTEQSILLLIDGTQVAEKQVQDLVIQLRSRQIPVVLFQVLRSFREHDQEYQPEGRKNLGIGLTDTDAGRFVVAFSSEVPEKRAQLESLANSQDERKRSAFYMGLEAFGKDFRGITHYVRTRLENLTAAQKQIIGFLAIAHHYAQSSIRAQTFADILGIPRNQPVDFKSALPTGTRELLVKGPEDTWQIIHDFVALEILYQLLGFGPNKEHNWNQNLSDWGRDFAYFCRGRETDIPSEEMLEIAKNVFIYRNKTDFLGTEGSASQRFAHFIEDIPIDAGRVYVLKTLAECYDENPHLWAHLGRYYAVRKQDIDQAVEYLDHAIRLNPNDHVLFHMKGVALREKVYQLLSDQTSSLENIEKEAKLAAKCFKETRKLRPTASYGYISEVEMLISVLDYIGGKQVDKNIFTYMKLTNADPFIQECHEQAEELLARVRWVAEDDEPSTFEARCRARLDKLCQNYNKALQTLDNLLHRPEADHPSIRRDIIWIHLARDKHDWGLLEFSSISRIISLLEENLQEEPYDDRNLRLWMRAIRSAAYPTSLDRLIERISYWRANTGSVDAIFYLYVCNMIKVLEGSVVARDDAKRFMEECARIMHSSASRTRPLEWYGLGSGYGGITRLVHHSEMGKRIPDEHRQGRGFWENTNKLTRVQGRITKYWNRQSGQIEVNNSGIFAFFVPARASIAQATKLDSDGKKVIYGSLDKSDIEQKVEFYLAFSYDGLRAWDVTSTGTRKSSHDKN